MTHILYKGSPGVLVHTLSGEVPIYFGAMSSPMAHVKAGWMRAILPTKLKRYPAASNIPTVHAQGITGFETNTWYGISAPAGTPTQIVHKLQADIVRAIHHPDVHDRLASEGVAFVGDTSEVLTAFVKGELKKWTRVVQTVGLKAE